MARATGWIRPTAVWAMVCCVGASVWAVQMPVADAFDTDPRVGSGRLERRAVAPVPEVVLPSLTIGGPVDAASLAARLAAVPAGGVGDVVGVVLDAETGEAVYRTGAGAATPASSMKVLSGLVALDVLGPGATFATAVLRTADGSLVLHGGGDPLLSSDPAPAEHPAPASLAELAELTVADLRSRGQAEVALGYDASLFAGPGWNPLWPETFATSVAAVSALTVDHARPNLASPVRSADPARLAAERFAAALGARGITVTAINPGGAAGATEIARVTSAPVGALVERSLLASDNDTAETLLWHVALARGRAATPTEAAATLADELRRLGLWSDAMAVHDGAGIPAENRVTPDALAGAVRLALARDELRPLITGLPVAAVSGTLAGRFEQPDADAARGIVRAKTGTIRGANSLTGMVVTADGRPLTFAFMVAGGAGQTSARQWLDATAAALASCGC